MTKRFIKIYVPIILVILASSCTNTQSGQTYSASVKSYPVKTLSFENVELQSVFPATLKGQEDVEIKPRVEGFIEAVYVDEGSKVKKGDALFKINSPSSVKSYEEAQANYNTAKLDVERIRPLAEKNIISKVQLESYENSLDAAEAALEQAKSTLSWTTVTSPVNGVVGTISYRIGSLVNNNSVLTTVANTSNVLAYFSINEKELYGFLNKWEGKTKEEKIKNIPEVTFVLSDGEEYEQTGKVVTISGIVNQTTGSVNIRASFPNENGLLLSGTSGNIIIPQYMDSALVVPQEATFSQQDKTMIYKVQGDSALQKIITVKSIPGGSDYVVLDGLSVGDQVVVEDVTNLSNGQKIEIQ